MTDQAVTSAAGADPVHAFIGETVKQHQAVYAALGGRVGGELHALQLETAVPQPETNHE